MFGVPGGGPNLDLVEACEDAGLRFVLTHGENAAAIMAATYGELTGRPGACLATRGPGAAALVNGVAHARLDRCPMLVVTDTVPRSDRRRISHQRLDQRQLVGAAAKASVRLGGDDRDEGHSIGAAGKGPSAEAIVRMGGVTDVARAAVAHACAPPWGPVHVDVDPSVETRPPAFEAPPVTAGAAALAKARELVAAARRPVLVVGMGARGKATAVRELVAAAGPPVLATYKAKGIVPEASESAAGLCTGAASEAPLLEAADLILAIGLDPVELIPAPWPYKAPVVAAGPWPIRETYFPLAAEVVGDLDAILADLAPALDASGWDRTGRDYRDETLEALTDPGGDGLTPHAVIAEARAAFPDDAIATVDSGAHMLVAMALWEVSEPGRALISSGLATMGFALPAAIAAGLVHPERRVVCFTGDGGLGMCLAELETLARTGSRVTVVVLDDAALSLIEIKQRPGGHGGPGAVRYGDVHFAAVAAAMGLNAMRATNAGELRAAVAKAAAAEGPALIDAVIDPSSYPEVLSAVRGPRGPE
jgi:acetolactate synthase-1/2/3 large subunit